MAFRCASAFLDLQLKLAFALPLAELNLDRVGGAPDLHHSALLASNTTEGAIMKRDR